jgi:GH35 family endo-1,4-beta-xylanase
MQTLEKTSLFWDVARSELDKEKHRRFIIERILARGDLDDLTWAKASYGEDALKQVFISAKSLDKRSVVFFAHYFNIDPASCTNKHSQQKLEPFWKR